MSEGPVDPDEHLVDELEAEMAMLWLITTVCPTCGAKGERTGYRASSEEPPQVEFLFVCDACRAAGGAK